MRAGRGERESNGGESPTFGKLQTNRGEFQIQSHASRISHLIGLRAGSRPPIRQTLAGWDLITDSVRQS